MPDEQARPDARSHVSADQVSDLLEGLLPSDEAATVAAHLSACPQCAEVRDRLAAMPALLASVRTDDPVVPMPADVAARLDRALAAEARDRAAAPAEQPAEEQQVADVVPISRAGRTRKVFAGLVAAAAVVVGFVVVGDVVRGSDGNDSADVTAADSDAGSAEAGGDARTKMGEGAPSPETSSQVLVQVSRRDFGADVTGLLAGSSRSTVGPDSAVAGGDAAPTACTPGQLAAAGISGSDGPVVLLGDAPVTLVTSGPRAQRLVVAYSCDNGSPTEQARAVVDLTG